MNQACTFERSNDNYVTVFNRSMKTVGRWTSGCWSEKRSRGLCWKVTQKQKPKLWKNLLNRFLQFRHLRCVTGVLIACNIYSVVVFYAADLKVLQVSLSNFDLFDSVFCSGTVLSTIQSSFSRDSPLWAISW